MADGPGTERGPGPAHTGPEPSHPGAEPPASPPSPEAAPLCDVCGAPMFERHCRIVCPRCGYQRDCSDP